MVFSGHGDLDIADDLGTIFSAPFVEEVSKAVCLWLLFFYRRKDFDGVVDGDLCHHDRAGLCHDRRISSTARPSKKEAVPVPLRPFCCGDFIAYTIRSSPA